ncbi:MAG: phosphoribosylformylglycinamidine synthase subunit PurS [Candidatus Rokubacteria bacterium]|nr:phosphoribosylformylglycinamidine synthase subunit PurS [Candidatus Rokubacteria bacterium]MBI3827222.1 phosphoribosylformylglycinamidine synthase subunit PurS [Candidatus Rokubacteria bacterium]
MKVRVLIRLRSSILDVQGSAVKRALGGLGFDDLDDLRVGKMIELEVRAASPEAARGRVDEMCRKLLANPLLEDYTVEVLPAGDLAQARAGR